MDVSTQKPSSPLKHWKHVVRQQLVGVAKNIITFSLSWYKWPPNVDQHMNCSASTKLKDKEN